MYQRFWDTGECIPMTVLPGRNVGEVRRHLVRNANWAQKFQVLPGLRGGWGLRQAGKASTGKEGFDPYWVLPLRDGQDFKQKVTLASHFKKREGPVQSICYFPNYDHWGPGWIWRMSLLGEVEAFWKGVWFLLAAWSAVWIERDGRKRKGRQCSKPTCHSSRGCAIVERIGEWTWAQNPAPLSLARWPWGSYSLPRTSLPSTVKWGKCLPCRGSLALKNAFKTWNTISCTQMVSKY